MRRVFTRINSFKNIQTILVFSLNYFLIQFSRVFSLDNFKFTSYFIILNYTSLQIVRVGLYSRQRMFEMANYLIRWITSIQTAGITASNIQFEILNICTPIIIKHLCGLVLVLGLLCRDWATCNWLTLHLTTHDILTTKQHKPWFN